MTQILIAGGIALAVSILMQLVTILGGLPGGVLWLIGKRQQPAAVSQ